MKIVKTLSRHGLRFSLSIIIMLVLMLNTIGLLNIAPISRLENFAYDVRLNMMMPRGQDQRIVIIDIDEKSLKEQGHWPWSRNKLASLVDRLFDDYHVHVMGFDVVFSERDESSGLKNLEVIKKQYFSEDLKFKQALDKLKPSLNYDQVFADSFKGRNIVLGYIFLSDEQAKEAGTLPKPVFSASTFAEEDLEFMTASGFASNLNEMTTSAKTSGHFNSRPDADGVVRKVPLLVQYHGQLYETLSVAVARLALSENYNSELKLEPGYANVAEVGEGLQSMNLEWFELGTRRIPIDGSGHSLIPYRGPQGSFKYVSATDVIQHKVNPKILENKIVLIGTTALGLMDLRATPVQSVYAGVETHANMIAGILDNNIKSSPAYTLGAEFVLLLSIGLVLAFRLPVLSPLKATLLTLIVMLAVIAVNVYAWQNDLVLPLAPLLLLITLVYVVNMSYGFFVESRSKKLLAGLFGQYVPPELVDEMSQNPEAISMEGDSREMTVLFSDVRGFTTISEGLDPKQLTQLMNEFLTPMTQIIHHGRGTIDKYMGDAIMAFWGAPLKDENHAKNALLAAIGMIKALGQLQKDFAAKGWPPINIGVGLNTGLMTVGNMGSEFRVAYTVIGDAVNLGSRLEGLTKNYGVHIIVSEFTKAKVPHFIYRELDVVRVNGKDKPVVIYEPICDESVLDTVTKAYLTSYDSALKLYRQQSWALAEEAFINLKANEPERYLYDVYIQRIQYFKHHPPSASWDGVFNFETK